jgi:hypothetical protein
VQLGAFIADKEEIDKTIFIIKGGFSFNNFATSRLQSFINSKEFAYFEHGIPVQRH